MGEDDPVTDASTENSTTLQAAFKKLKIDPEWNESPVINSPDSDSLHRLWAWKNFVGKDRSCHQGTCRPKGDIVKGCSAAKLSCSSHRSARSRAEPYTLDCIGTMEHLSFKSELCTKVNCGCKKSKPYKGGSHPSGLSFVPSKTSLHHDAVWDDKLKMRNSEKDRKQIIRSAKLRLYREGKGFQPQPFFPFGKVLKNTHVGRQSSPLTTTTSTASVGLPVFGSEAHSSQDFLSVTTSSRCGDAENPSRESGVSSVLSKVFSESLSRPAKRPVEGDAKGFCSEPCQQGLKRKSPSRLKSLPCERKHKTCSQQAKISVDDFSVNELASYFENYVYIPKKMSSMAEMMYT